MFKKIFSHPSSMLPPSLSELRRTSRRASKILSFLPHILVLLFFFALAVFAWTEPSQAPPGGNVSAPINIGSSNQVKSGGLWLGSLGVDGGATIGGNVGIGTAAPLAKLQTQLASNVSTIGTGAGIKLTMANTNAVGNIVELGFATYPTATRNHATIGLIETSGAGYEKGDLYFAITDVTATQDNPLERMRITSAGNVGIGTTAPTLKFDIRGNLVVSDSPNPTPFSWNPTTIGDDIGVSISGSGSILQERSLPGLGSSGPYQAWVEDTLGQIASLNFNNNGNISASNFSWSVYSNFTISTDRQLILNSGSSGLILNSFGNRVGVGVSSPAYLLDVGGQVHGSSFPASSDIRFKENVSELTNVLEKLKDIRGVTFDWNETYASLGRAIPGRQVGLIAQEVEKYFPELVTTWSQNGVNDYRSVDYGRFSAVLLEAIKEQQAQIEELQKEIQSLKSK